MPALALPDLLAFAWFLIAWIGYSVVIERSPRGRLGLNALLNIIVTTGCGICSRARTASSMRR